MAASTAAVVGSCLLAGCSGSSTPSAPETAGATASTGGAAGLPADLPAGLPADLPQKAACGLVTQAEVEAAVGERVSAAEEEVQPARSLCSFSLVSAADQSVVILSTSSSGVPASFASNRAKAQGRRDVSAGDEAFVAGRQALVRKGNTMVIVLVAIRQEGEQLAATATRLVQAVGARL